MATGRGRRIAGRTLAVLAASLLALATIDDAEARRGGGGGGRSGTWSRGGGGGGGGDRHHHHGRHGHFHSFVFTGIGLGAAGAYYPAYYGYPPAAAPAYLPPPVYVSKDAADDCYNTVPRSPGVADLYTCGGQYVGPISVP